MPRVVSHPYALSSRTRRPAHCCSCSIRSARRSISVNGRGSNPSGDPPHERLCPAVRWRPTMNGPVRIRRQSCNRHGSRVRHRGLCMVAHASCHCAPASWSRQLLQLPRRPSKRWRRLRPQQQQQQNQQMLITRRPSRWNLDWPDVVACHWAVPKPLIYISLIWMRVARGRIRITYPMLALFSA